MKRLLTDDLIEWQHSINRSPLLVRGARQVGKSHLIQSFGEQYFHDCITINFEKEAKYKLSFKNFNPQDILNNLYTQSGKIITPGKTLLFLDEIQECTSALIALRYFKEEMPEQHIIAAGSLLEFTLNSEKVRMPVGRVDSLFLKPLSFHEYLLAQKPHLLEQLSLATLETGISSLLHEELSYHLRHYFFLGGMPAIVNEFIQTQQLPNIQSKQLSLLQAYRDDFGKYSHQAQHKYMQRILDEAPGLIGKRFLYSKIDPDMGSREIKNALAYIIDAGLLYKIYQTSGSGLPLKSAINPKKFKTLFLDIGLANASSYLSPELLLHEDLMLINRGAQAEQFVGQELLAYTTPYHRGELYYWEREQRTSTAEIDYLINLDDKIIPIEVKAGKTGSLKSLQNFLNEKSGKFGIRIGLRPLSFHNRVLTIPLYMIRELPRIAKQLL